MESESIESIFHPAHSLLASFSTTAVPWHMLGARGSANISGNCLNSFLLRGKLVANCIWTANAIGYQTSPKRTFLRFPSIQLSAAPACSAVGVVGHLVCIEKGF